MKPTRQNQPESQQMELEWRRKRDDARETVAEAPVPAAPAKPRKVSFRRVVEQFLRDHHLPYISVDEAKKALFSGAKLQSFHFVVYRPTAKNWLVFAAWLRKESRENMREWEAIFGDGFVAVHVSQRPDGSLRWRTLDGQEVRLLDQGGAPIA